MGRKRRNFSDIFKHVKWKPTAWNPTRNFKKKTKKCVSVSQKSKQTFTQDQTKKEV